VFLVVGVLILVALMAVGLRWRSYGHLGFLLSRIRHHASSITSHVRGALTELPVLPMTLRFVRTKLVPAEPPADLVASGFIWANEIMVSTEVAGRIQRMQADVGDEVSAGQVLAQLDTALVEAQTQRAEAELQVAEAKVVELKAGASPGEIEVAEAAVDKAREEVALAEEGVALAQANVAAAQKTLQAAQAALSKLRSGASPYELALAEARLELAQGQLRGACSARDSIGGAMDRGEMPSASYDAARAAVAQAQTRIYIIQLEIDELKEGARPEDLQAGQAAIDAAHAEVEAAQAQVVRAQQLVEAARASLREAQNRSDLVKSGATKEQIAMAQAQVSGAQAALQALVIRRNKMTLRAPSEGLVLERIVNVGEMVMPGSTLFRLADLDQVQLTVYVSETDMGRIQLGQEVHVAVDSFPELTFPGHVVYISPRAEFTPRNIQTKDQLVTQVLAVKIELSNPDHALKPGMPADATFPGLKTQTGKDDR